MREMKLRTAIGSLFVVTTAIACSTQPSSSFTTSSNATLPHGSAGFGTGGSDGGAAASAGCQQDPSFYDVPGDNCDNDGDGKVDNPKTCDAALTGNTAVDFAHALGICEDATKDGYGLVSATFARGFDDQTEPDDGQHGILAKFGDVVKPREGGMLGVLSSGLAQEFDGSPGTPFTQSKEWWDTTSTQRPPGRLSEGGRNLHPIERRLRRHRREPDVEGAQERGWHEVRLRLPLERVAAVDLYAVQRRLPRIPDVIRKDRQHLVRRAEQPGQREQRLLRPLHAERDRRAATVRRPRRRSARAAHRAQPAGTTASASPRMAANDGQQATQGGATGLAVVVIADRAAEEQFTLQLAIWDTGDSELDSSVLLDNFQWVAGSVVATTTERP